MNAPLLQIDDLRTWIDAGDSVVRAIDGLSLQVRRGECVALLGESGCGKSMTALSIMRLLPESGEVVTGEIRLGDERLLRLPEIAMRSVRGRRVAMIFQEPMLSLNPVMTVGEQVAETLIRHTDLAGEPLRARVVELLDSVGIPDPARRADEYPFQLSGGMKQRVVIAMALACEPELLIADEPTTALDVTIQAQILDVLRELQRSRGMALLLITHDLGVVSKMADRVAVMYAGQIVESASREVFFSAARHPYSNKLFDSVPSRHKRGGMLAVIAGAVPSLAQSFSGCRFADRCDHVMPRCRVEVPSWHAMPDDAGVLCHLYETGGAGLDRRGAASIGASAPIAWHADEARSQSAVPNLLVVRDLAVHFPIHKGLFRRVAGWVKAVDGVSLEIPAGRTLALVGESGCGKTTIGKAILRLIEPTSGAVEFDGCDLASLNAAALRTRRNLFQIIFQDPYSSLNPRMRVADILAEGMESLGVGIDEADRSARIDALLGEVGLAPDAKLRYPHEFSGGQRQRIAIARALAVEPKLIICDEPTSALDVSVQAQILNLLRDLQQRHGLTYLFITHNLSVVEFLAHEVAVMYLGRIVESGPADEVLGNPRHPYTQALLSAVPHVEASEQRTEIRLHGDMPSPASPPPGCHFHPRCPMAGDPCRLSYPVLRRVGQGSSVACHLVQD